ncbi:50S ribosomal protein L14e [Candidatus Mancarchaeum acidiphilum]|uniref:50S ribosomal protein L14e n=1 Tax=Candidatus Mancarchaeum acidiphilum TaxID=1920749 RepID=A0A218NP76_9ARCH|nr:50S ribosomal protein L14e [Candidatus Mancarchaeum acidiphilum]ASI14289.1 50S ribosomal protein L14e [Candidatus Mancarchaeum acidiphilum]
MLVEVGRVCVKKFGRDAGSAAVITSIEKDGFVKIVTSKRPKERRCNIRHLEFINTKIDVENKDLLNRTLGISNKKE